MSKDDIENVYSLVNPIGENIENKLDYSGKAIETFSNGDEYDGNLVRGVNIIRKNKEKENIHSLMEIFMKENL